MTRLTNDPSLDEALAIPGRVGVTARKATGAHPDCRCGREIELPPEPVIDWPDEQTRAERQWWWQDVVQDQAAWVEACKQARRCPQHDPEVTP